MFGGLTAPVSFAGPVALGLLVLLPLSAPVVPIFFGAFPGDEVAGPPPGATQAPPGPGAVPPPCANATEELARTSASVTPKVLFIGGSSLSIPSAGPTRWSRRAFRWAERLRQEHLVEHTLMAIDLPPRPPLILSGQSLWRCMMDA